ncbi:hypothetical protein FMUND_15806 [Fusarium mundagurra]|uniref:Uncharacterized protein n=1 Tax=Fusarium mundagurra TaxID=1567541 RepID=A0A8H6CXM5_9HYPO|nr:hypothetical protein FMUND_15806 [Fusarium mundagurra]
MCFLSSPERYILEAAELEAVEVPFSETSFRAVEVLLKVRRSDPGTGLSAEPVEPTNFTPESTIELKPDSLGNELSEFSTSTNAAMKDASSSPFGTVFTEPVFTEPVFTHLFMAEPASTLADWLPPSLAPLVGPLNWPPKRSVL